MPVQPLSYEYLSSLYTLSSAFPVCCRRAWYEARIHPLASSPSAPRRRWLKKRSSETPQRRWGHKRLLAIRCLGQRMDHEQTHPSPRAN
jgi:hypothetical protein